MNIPNNDAVVLAAIRKLVADGMANATICERLADYGVTHLVITIALLNYVTVDWDTHSRKFFGLLMHTANGTVWTSDQKQLATANVA